MPLLKKQPFVKKEPPSDLRDDEEIFYCALTKEIFRDYEEFFERIIVCNSLVWTCSVSGRFGLTYQEALDSEEKALKCLESFPDKLQIPILFVASQTKCATLNDLCDEVFLFAKDRYFVGEDVYVTTGQKRLCEVLKVLSPSEEELIKAQRGLTKEQLDSKTYIADLYRYIVKELNNSSPKTFTVKGKNLCRRKGIFTRVKNKLFLKQHTVLDNKYRIVRPEFYQKYALGKVNYSDIFTDVMPEFGHVKTTLESGTSTIKPKINDEHSYEKTTFDTEKQKAIEIEQRKIEREQKREEMKQKAEYLKNWQKSRDDLLCDDLRPFPTHLSKPISTELTGESFSNILITYEFLQSFADLLGATEETFSCEGGVLTFDFVQKALLSDEPIGPLTEILNFLLVSIFHLQSQEEYPNEFEDCSDELMDELRNQHPLIREATINSALANTLYGLTLKELNHLDNSPTQYTITEILRLHLLSAGGLGHHKNALHRYQQRGGYTPKDDPGLELKMMEPNLIHQLETKAVYELSPDLKSKILVTLINQLLTFVTLREYIEENLEKVRLLRNDLRSHNYSQKDPDNAVSLQLVANTIDQIATNTSTLINEPKLTMIKPEKELTVNTEVSSVDVKPEPTELNTVPQTTPLAPIKKLNKEQVLTQIHIHQSRGAIFALGKDRSFRRYWALQDLPAMLIEDFELDPGDCLSTVPTPIYQKTLNYPCGQSSASESDENTDSDELEFDNCYVLEHKKEYRAVKTLLKDMVNLLVTDEKDATTAEPERTAIATKSPEEIRVERLLCTASKPTCPVHSATVINQRIATYQTVFLNSLENKRPIWTIAMNVRAFKRFVDKCLNKRGFREKALKASLEERYDIYKLCVEKGNQFIQSFGNAKDLNTGLTSLPIEQISPVHEFRDMLLDLEDRIFTAALGHVYVHNRLEWRLKLENEEYKDPIFYEGLDEAIDAAKEIDDTASIDDESQSILTLKCLARCLVQIAKGIDTRYLQAPFGENEEIKQMRLKNAFDPNIMKTAGLNIDIAIPPPTQFYRRWEYTLLNCIKPLRIDNTSNSGKGAENVGSDLKYNNKYKISNISQLYLNYALVDKCITWAKSLLKVRCKVCRKKNNPEQLLLCDACNKGHHTYCVKPKIKKVPEGDWFCNSCRQILCPATFASSTAYNKGGKRPQIATTVSKLDQENSLSIKPEFDDLFEHPPSILDENSDASLLALSDDNEENNNEEKNHSFHYELTHSNEQKAATSFSATINSANSMVVPKSTVSKATKGRPLKSAKTALAHQKISTPSGSPYCQVCGKGEEDKMNGDNNNNDQTKLVACNRCKSVIVHHPSCSVSLDAAYLQTPEFVCPACLKNPTTLNVPETLVNSPQLNGIMKKENQHKKASGSGRPRKIAIQPRSENTLNDNETSIDTDDGSHFSRSGRKIKRSNKYEDSYVEEVNLIDNLGYNPANVSQKRGRKRTKHLDDFVIDSNSSQPSTQSPSSNISIEQGQNQIFNPIKSTRGRKRTNYNSINDDAISNHLMPGQISPNTPNHVRILQDDIIKALKKHPDSWPFLKPVSKTKVPDYYTIVQTPMDLQTLKSKVDTQTAYNTGHECNDMKAFLTDCRLIFTNCYTYNTEDSPISLAARGLEGYLRAYLQDISIKFSSNNGNIAPPMPKGDDQLGVEHSLDYKKSLIDLYEGICDDCNNSFDESHNGTINDDNSETCKS